MFPRVLCPRPLAFARCSGGGTSVPSATCADPSSPQPLLLLLPLDRSSPPPLPPLGRSPSPPPPRKDGPAECAPALGEESGRIRPGSGIERMAVIAVGVYPGAGTAAAGGAARVAAGDAERRDPRLSSRARPDGGRPSPPSGGRRCDVGLATPSPSEPIDTAP